MVTQPRMFPVERASRRSDTSEEDRKYPRVSTDVRVKWSGGTVDRFTREYVDDIAKDLSSGGVFIATKRPLPKGSVVRVQFSTAPGEPPVLVKAIVRWRRRWRSPRGMGLAFYESEGLAGRDRETWMKQIVGRHIVGRKKAS